MIVQGTNRPIELEYDSNMAGISAFHATLYAGHAETDAWQGYTVLHEWDKGDVTISGTKIRLPLSEAETATYPSGVVTLDIKWVEDGMTNFADSVKMWVAARGDRGALFGV